MFCKIIATFLLAMPLVLGGISVPVQEASVDSNNTINQIKQRGSNLLIAAPQFCSIVF